jgi:hypothetical protein
VILKTLKELGENASFFGNTLSEYISLGIGALLAFLSSICNSDPENFYIAGQNCLTLWQYL